MRRMHAAEARKNFTGDPRSAGYAVVGSLGPLATHVFAIVS
ncbi:hypothetical protein [Desulfosoma caldarium]|nr:hypothetical protein [Desulfosoma caldarium]